MDKFDDMTEISNRMRSKYYPLRSCHLQEKHKNVIKENIIHSSMQYKN